MLKAIYKIVRIDNFSNEVLSTALTEYDSLAEASSVCDLLNDRNESVNFKFDIKILYVEV